MEFSSVAFQWGETGSLARTAPQSPLDGVRRSCHPLWRHGPPLRLLPSHARSQPCETKTLGHSLNFCYELLGSRAILFPSCAEDMPMSAGERES